jgi:hypothetical protein
VLLILAAIGCGPRVGHVTGKVLFKDKPLQTGTVLFVSPDGSRQGFSPIAADGFYRIENVPVGTVKIAVVSEPRVPPGLKAAKPPFRTSDQTNEDYVPIPLRYMDPEHSGLTCTVEAGKQTHDLILKP